MVKLQPLFLPSLSVGFQPSLPGWRGSGWQTSPLRRTLWKIRFSSTVHLNNQWFRADRL